ncbi:hypothetical protein MANI_002368 [Metarhizium anisopliae]
MDLLNTIRKTGSRGGADFSWDEVANSSHRENYLGHSLKAPVGRWQKGRDLNWYAKADDTPANSAETDEERLARVRKEELRKIKEAEEDAIARTLGLPIPQRNTSGANAVDVGQQRQIGPRSGPPPGEDGDGKVKRERSRRDEGRRERRRHRSRSRDRDDDRDDEKRRRRRSRDRESRRHRSRDRRGHDRDERPPRSERNRSRSGERRYRREDRDYHSGDRRRHEGRRRDHHRDRSQSPRPMRQDD